jgi:hypothetical protein
MSVQHELPCHPFEDDRYMGTVTRVLPSTVYVNLPLAGTTSGKVHHGQRIAGGEVGEFVVVESDNCGLFGRVLEVRLPERERLEVEAELGKTKDLHPVGVIQLLGTISLTGDKPVAGVSRHPRLGNRVFSAHPDLVRWVIRRTQSSETADDSVSIDFGSLPNVENAPVEFSPEQLFGRHCAILGSTGGGKSWTIARLISQSLLFSSKIILIDATGEFRSLDDESVSHVELGGNRFPLQTHSIECGEIHVEEPLGTPSDPVPVNFPHKFLTEEDLFAIFTPSIQSQAPKLREAMKSLKLAKLEPSLATNGLIIKADQSNKEFYSAYQKHIRSLDKPEADFDIGLLVEQIKHECLKPSYNNGKWGKADEMQVGWCVSLLSRIESIINSQGLRCIFQSDNGSTVPSVINDFLNDNKHRVLRITMSEIPFANNAREIVVNAIGRLLLDMARNRTFSDNPLLVFLDEAHQFLNKKIGNDELKSSLDAFGLIAKEGRKYGLCVCIATQRPRDIPEDVLSQIGTLIVHRLINDRDRGACLR